MPQLYALANVAIYPSTYPEPLGLAPVEPAAAGRPVVVTRTGGPPENPTESCALNFESIRRTILSTPRSTRVRTRESTAVK